MRVVVISVVLALLAGCANPRGTVTGPSATGDERGGKVPYVGNISAANNAVRMHCEQFGKKGYITQMDLSPEGGGMIVCECH